ncbi:MAG TPA: fatty acid desaturase [Polyangiaceae bacterium LLY-WYZ-15_(1-7)]|nr:alkane 1-monooxygenase [Sandaracinus sp.]HJK91929.1 fatty acid desaturase [Polyangiaceae bacterium LLY-WYZ-15_(1-7)]HJL00199.1 fatty acid desaturase [Polyangiaceae bacterium LLY-WYZ-15_(1-7)]HJL08851.1 fatty acid desaturase [Polyangiaceae bacterium LLY-WYZ-15_(1-7)]HJL22719.1 fatty acid desaturase [Polyangiaceae bacterium LLY-WYZ-15_(1-7)]
MRLRYAADIRTLFFVALYFGTLAFLWVATPEHWANVDWRWWAPAFVVLLVTSFQGAVSTHNAVHCPIFKSRPMNKLWQVVLTLTYGHPVSSYVPGHNLSHHKHTQSRRDVMRTTKLRFRWHLLNLLFFFLRCVPSIMKADSSYAKAMRTRHPRWFRQLVIEGVALWVVQIALFVLDWQKALVLWIVPHLYAQWGIVTMNLLQHDGCDETTEYDHSRNFVGKVVNWFTFNNGFHTIHHMKPGLHWSLTPEAHAELVAPHIHPELDQKSLVKYLFVTFVLNRRVRPDGTPYFPPPDGPDEEWLPRPEETADDLGAEGLPGEELAAQVAHAPQPR